MANPARLDLELVRGDDEIIEIELVDSTGTAIDLTGRSYVMQVRSDPDSTSTPDCSFTCSVSAPTNGRITASAPYTQTDGLKTGHSYWWSLLEVAEGHQSTLLTGRVKVLSQVAKD